MGESEYSKRAKELRRIYREERDRNQGMFGAPPWLMREMLNPKTKKEMEDAIYSGNVLSLTGADLPLDLEKKRQEYFERLKEKLRKNEPMVRAYAKILMDQALEDIKPDTMDLPEGHIYRALWGAEIYERLGKGRRATSKLKRVLKKYDSTEDEETRQEAEAFIKRNSEKKHGGLEERTGIFILFLLGGIALSFFSLTATGNAISNLTGTTQGLFGVFLFIAGIFGLAFNSWKKR